MAPCCTQELPHPWFTFLQTEASRLLQSGLRRKQWQIHRIIGGRTPLDLASTKPWPKELFVYSHAEGPFEEEQTKYYSVKDDVVLTLTLTVKTAAALKKLYQQAGLNAQLVSTFYEPAKIRMVLERHPRKARRLLRKFSNYFGTREQL